MIEVRCWGSSPPGVLKEVEGVLSGFPGSMLAVVVVLDADGRDLRRLRLAGAYSRAPVVLSLVEAIDGVESVRVVAG